MNRLMFRISEPRSLARSLALSLVIVLASNGDWVYSSFENRSLSNMEKYQVLQKANRFLSRVDGIKVLDQGENEAPSLGPVRFSDCFGYSVAVNSRAWSLEVLLDCDSECVTTYKDKANRNLLEGCGSPTEKREGHVKLSEANQATLEFIKAQDQLELLRQLAPERSALECFGSEEYYQFVWREQYDQESVAVALVRIEVLVNPITGVVYMYQFTKSEIDNDVAYDPKVGREGALLSSFCGEGCSIEGMALFALHHRDGSTCPAWAVRVTSQPEATHQSTILFVNAETGREIPSS